MYVYILMAYRPAGPQRHRLPLQVRLHARADLPLAVVRAVRGARVRHRRRPERRLHPRSAHADLQRGRAAQEAHARRVVQARKGVAQLPHLHLRRQGAYLQEPLGRLLGWLTIKTPVGDD